MMRLIEVARYNKGFLWNLFLSHSIAVSSPRSFVPVNNTFILRLVGLPFGTTRKHFIFPLIFLSFQY